MPSLAGLGQAGLWQVDIDREEEYDHGYSWSVTLSHPSCHIQWALDKLAVLEELVCHLTNPDASEQLFRISDSTGVELLIGVVEERLTLRVGRGGHFQQKQFPWMLEVSLQREEVNSLSKAVRDAYREALLP